jgi:hypothetical protein
MTSSALILMITVQTCVTLITVYFFIKVLKSPPKEKQDENEEISKEN